MSEMDISLWKVKDTNRSDRILGQVLTFERSFDRNKVVSKSLSGEIYVQTIGYAITYADVKVFCTRDERYWMGLAEAQGNYLRIQYRDLAVWGYIEDVPEWSTIEPGEYCECTFKFLIVAESQVNV